MALPVLNRLSLKKNKGEFFESGISFYTPHLQVLVLRDSFPNPLFAISVSKKVAKKAHARNRLRRQISFLIQKNLPHFSPGQYLFLPKKQATEVSFIELSASFSQLLSKLK